MAMVFDILEEERQRLIRLKDQYERQLSGLPKGSLSRKKRWNKEYIYLVYRESDKVKFEYVGPIESEAVKEIADKIKLRKELAEKLRHVEKNLIDVERGLRAKR